jgi:curved DNA-binding protein
LGANWKAGAEFRPPPGWEQFSGARVNQRGGPGGADYEFHFGGTGFSDFFEQILAGAAGGFGAGTEEYAERGAT